MGKLGILLVLSSLFLSCGKPEYPEEVEEDEVEVPVSPPPARAPEPLPRRQPNFQSVTAIYGPTIVREGIFEMESKTIPWSSSYFPARDTYLFQGTPETPSPLEKYDAFVKKAHNEEPGAARYQREKLYDPDAAGWEGLCNAWSVASTMEPQPKKEVERAGIKFGVGDLKALLILTYEYLDGLLEFGQRFNAAGPEEEFDDIYPDQFHRLIQAELFEKGRPFVMDKEPGIQVWNMPVWQVKFNILRDRSEPTTLHVKARLTAASPFIEERGYDYVGTLPIEYIYTYDLHGKVRDDGALEVESGEWTGESRRYHPDFMTVLPTEKSRKSYNVKLNNAYVEEILGASVPEVLSISEWFL